ncbi:NAD(P)-binding protein [Meira miltonrushii]|uniref:NAD(P)-binding protein n=1 Tax=Meira miltonrushii TaxID=1280837 RepID=A0A316V2Z4_9BASI|nr:NAD(P)-binding protein [Meira miltonrushii]PWN31624.1 NAD(P)-binding protein [Meira miltonrushii]
MKTLFESLFRSNAWLRIYSIIAITRLINRIGARLVIDGSAPRTIRWSDHLVVITGGSRGMGGRVCELLKEKGARVVVIDKAAKSLHGKEDLFLEADVTKEEELIQARKQVHSELGYPTMLISAAGIARHSVVMDPPHRFPSSFSNAVIDVNLKGSFNFVKVFGQDLLSDYDEEQDQELFPIRNNFGGHILMIGSGAAFAPLPANATYNASKAGIVSLHHTLNYEIQSWHKSDRVRNSVFCPLMIHTDMTKDRMKEQKNQFIFPTLTVDQAAAKIVKVLEQDRSQVFFAPAGAYALSLLMPNLPAWLIRLVANGGGSGSTFSEYLHKQRLPIGEH